MAENIWTVEKTEIDYSKPEATYFGVTEKNGKQYRDEQKVDLNEAILQSFHDPNMQKWQGLKDAIGQLTGASSWTFDSIAKVIKYVGVSIDPEDPTVKYLYQTTLSSKLYTSLDVACEDAVSILNQDTRFSHVLTSITSNQCRFTQTNLITGDINTNTGVVHIKVSNPNYNPNAVAPTQTITYQQVAQKIISNLQSSNEGTALLAEAYIDEVAKSFVTPVFDDSIVPTEVPTEVPDFVCPINENFINYQEKARGRYTYILDTPEFDALVQTLLEQRMERQCQYLMLKDSMFDIDKSKGSALDQIGRLVGQPRMLINFITDPYFGFEGARNAQAYNIGTWYTLNAASRGAVAILDDEMYKRTIKARIIKNGSNNSRSDLLNVLNVLGGGMESVKVEYTSHGNILITLNEGSDPDGLISYFLSRVMREDSIIPRQLGYRIKTKFEV